MAKAIDRGGSRTPTGGAVKPAVTTATLQAQLNAGRGASGPQVAAALAAKASPDGSGSDYGPGTAKGNAARQAASAGNYKDSKSVGGPRRYNASLHPEQRPMLTNTGEFAGSNYGTGPKPYATGEIYALFEQKSIQGDDGATGSPWYKRTLNWAFRFLYNPAQIQVSTQIDQSATPTNLDPGVFFGQQQALGFQLYINRMAEMARGAQNVDLSRILQYGTQYDINHLFRVVNGDAGDVGFLVNTLVRVSFGPNNYYEGFITNIDATHSQFNSQMVPMVSTVNLNVTRVSQINGPATDTA